jgi:hypothetical protein
MEIHQRKHQGIEDREHVGYGGNANPASVFPQSHITAPVETIFHGPMVADQVKEPFCRTALTAETGPAIDDLHAAFRLSSCAPAANETLARLLPTPGADTH